MDDWVLDSLVGFLKSPTWSSAVSSFTDKNCVVFDPGEENKFSYTDIHREYQKLVEDLLEKFTAELGITGQQFTHACALLQTSKAGQENEELFEQILAADDFLLFKANMVRRNIDLELQALTLLQKQMGQSPQAYDKESVSRDPGSTDSSKKRLEEERLLEEAMKQSEAQYKLECSMDEEELQRMIEQAKRESLELYQKQQQLAKRVEGGEERRRNRVVRSEGGKPESQESKHFADSKDFGGNSQPQVERRERKEADSLRTLPTTIADSYQLAQNPQGELLATASDKLPPPPAVDKTTESKTEVTPERGQQRTEGQDGGVKSEDAMVKWLEVAKAGLSSDPRGSAHSSPAPHSCQHTTGPTPEELKARERYLKKQRDQLMEAKRKQRTQSSSVGRASRQPATRGEVSGERELGSTGVRGGGEERGGRRGKDTGILSSAIAGNLKKV